MRHSGEMQEQKEPQTWNSPLKSVLPAHVEDWLRDAEQGMLKHFLRTHKSLFNGFPLARSSSGGGDYFLLPTLKKMQKPMGPPCITPQLCLSSSQCLLMTRMPLCNSLNNYRQDREEAVSEWWNVDFIITRTHQHSCRRHVRLQCWREETLSLPGGPQADMLFMYPACYVIDSAPFDLWSLLHFRRSERLKGAAMGLFLAGLSHCTKSESTQWHSLSQLWSERVITTAVQEHNGHTDLDISLWGCIPRVELKYISIILNRKLLSCLSISDYSFIDPGSCCPSYMIWYLGSITSQSSDTLQFTTVKSKAFATVSYFVPTPRCSSVRETRSSDWASSEIMCPAWIIESSCSLWESRDRLCGQRKRENSLWLFIHAAGPMTSTLVTWSHTRQGPPVREQLDLVLYWNCKGGSGYKAAVTSSYWKWHLCTLECSNVTWQWWFVLKVILSSLSLSTFI